MHPPHQHSRIDLAELKAQIVRKLGPDRSKQYFSYLNRLLSLKLSKVEFNKLCVKIVGRENIPLHNQFIRSILKNASSAKVPPPAPKPAEVGGDGETLNDNYHQNGPYAAITQASSSPGLSNGDILPLSPRKARTAFRDRRGGDRRSALAQNGKTNLASQQFTTTHSKDASFGNGALTLIDTLRPTKLSDNGPVSVHSTDQIESASIEYHRDLYDRSPLQAPLGVPFCPVSVGGTRRPSRVPASSICNSASNYGALLDSITLRERMEQIAVTHGIEGVSIDCANLLNNGLDAYLKGIIKSCIELVGARLGHESARNITQKPQAYTKLINGVRTTDNRFQMHERRPYCPISLQDFRVAMELNPQQLGEDWPLLLEKICIDSFEE